MPKRMNELDPKTRIVGGIVFLGFTLLYWRADVFPVRYGLGTRAEYPNLFRIVIAVALFIGAAVVVSGILGLRKR